MRRWMHCLDARLRRGLCSIEQSALRWFFLNDAGQATRDRQTPLPRWNISAAYSLFYFARGTMKRLSVIAAGLLVMATFIAGCAYQPYGPSQLGWVNLFDGSNF